MPITTSKTFVANHVSEIQELMSNCQWHHVAASSNPANMVSRGVLSQELVHNDLWWHGPDWVTENLSQQPKDVTISAIEEIILETRPVVTLIAVTVSDDILKHLSTLL